MRTSIIILLFIFTSFFAQAQTDDKYFQISSIQIESINEEGISSAPVELGTLDELGVILSQARNLIAFGKEVYEIIKAGKPVINTVYAPISVLPRHSDFAETIVPADLSNWKVPVSKKFKVSYKNGYGTEVIGFVYNVNMSYGGSLGGKGAYIANAQIVPETISVSWGYNFDAKMSLVGLTNLGTDEDAIAGATLQLSYTVTTVLKEERNNMTIFIAGDGSIQSL